MPGAHHLTPDALEAAVGAHAAQQTVAAISEGRAEPSYAWSRCLALHATYGRRSVAVEAFVCELAKEARRPGTAG